MMLKFKKIFLFIFLSGIMLPGMLAGEKWLDKNAKYRISFTLPKKGMPGFWQAANYAFPFDLKDGFSVFDENGKKYNFFFDLRRGKLILAAPEKANEKIYIYPNKESLKKILKNRRYYVPDRYIRDWNWLEHQPASQAVNIKVLSYEPDPRAKAKAEAIAKAKAKAKARFEAKIKAKAKVRAKAQARAKARMEAQARIIAKAKAEAEAKALAKAKAELKAQAEAKAKAEAIAKIRTEVESKTKAEILIKTQTKAEAEAKARAKAEARILAQVKAEAKARAKAEAKAKAEARIKAKAEERARNRIKIPKKLTKRKTEKKPLKKREFKWKYHPKRPPRIGHLPAKDFPDDTADLKKIFKYKSNQYIYRRNYRDTNIIRPIIWRMQGKYVAYIDVKLNIPQPGEYQFAVKSNDMVQLYINGESSLDINKKNASTGKWHETRIFDLSVNPVKIEAYYRSSMDNTSIAIGWRAAGEKDYKFISQKDYVEFNKVTPQTLTSSNGGKLPVIKYNTLGYFQNNKGKQFLLGFETNFPGAKIDWQIDGKTIDHGNKIMMTFADKIPDNISCKIDNLEAFKVTIPQAELKNPGDLLKRDLYIKINAPTVIYDDEILDLSAEFHSELQIDTRAFLEAKSNSDIFKEFKFSHAFNKTSNEPLFRKRDFVKKHFKLEGARIKNGTELEFSIKSSADNMKSENENFYFDHKKIIFKELSECPELKTENGHFIDEKGNRLILVLHRPTLKDKRSWSLLNSLPAILGKQSALIICDDFGDERKFSEELSDNAESSRQKLFFEDWQLKAFDADIVKESANKINLIRESKAGILIIVPSTYPVIRGISPRLQQRLLAALIQSARNNKNIRKIILTTPFPLAGPFSENKTLETVLENIQNLVTEQEISFMSLPEFPEDEEKIISNTHPVTRTKEYADILIKPSDK